MFKRKKEDREKKEDMEYKLSNLSNLPIVYFAYGKYTYNSSLSSFVNCNVKVSKKRVYYRETMSFKIQTTIG